MRPTLHQRSSIRLIGSVFLLFLISSTAGVSIVKIGNNGAANSISVDGVGAGAFDPKKISNWHYDNRFPLISPQGSGSCRNIYAANVVNNGETCWNVYFGGWDGVNSCHDSISVTVTEDSFATMNQHDPQIATGSDMHCNNPSAVKMKDEWMMVYTQLPYTPVPMRNKPGRSRGPNGVVWSPDAGGQSWLTMSNYPNWPNADVNGGNVLFYENGTFHLFFIDFQKYPGVYRAVSTDGLHYSYAGVAAPNFIVNDVKKINGYYVMALHENGPEVFLSVGKQNISSGFPPAQVLFPHLGSADLYIVSIGLVVDASETVLMGALYGAGPVSALDQNSIFAAWLQRQVLFKSADNTTTIWGLGAATRSVGPNTLTLLTDLSTMEGRFWVFDCDDRGDGTGTLLFVSPVVTVANGDVWELIWG